MLANDVLGVEEIQPAESNMEYESDFESEIQTEPDQSVSEISEHLGLGDGDASIASEVWDESRRAGRSSPRERHGKSERSVSYSSRMEGDRSDGSRSDGKSDSYSRTSSSASHSDTITPPRERRKSCQTVREAGVQTQMDGLSYTWTSGLFLKGPVMYTFPLFYFIVLISIRRRFSGLGTVTLSLRLIKINLF